MNRQHRNRVHYTQQHLAYHAKGEWHKDGDLFRWNMGNAIPMDIIESWADAGLITEDELERGRAAHDINLSEFLASYRQARAAGPSAEERAEARAAHGPGVKLVDIVTGFEWTT